MKREEVKIVPLYQKSKGTLIVTAALELSENQVTHFYSTQKNTEEMLKLLEILLMKYANQSCIYFSWDAASWHAAPIPGTRRAAGIQPQLAISLQPGGAADDRQLVHREQHHRACDR